MAAVIRATLTVMGRPWTLNDERSQTMWKHREQTDRWRAMAMHAARGQLPGTKRVPHLQWARVIATPYVVHPLADPGNNYPAVKAIIDGCVDAGVLINDTGEFVPTIIMHAPVKIKDRTQQRVEVVLEGPIRLESP